MYNRSTDVVTRNEEFYAFEHVGAFVRRGAQVVASTVVDRIPSTSPESGWQPGTGDLL